MKKTKLLAAALLIVLMAVLFGACGGSGIDMEDYVTVEFQGANGYGRADISFDEDALIDDLLKDHEKKLKKATKNFVSSASVWAKATDLVTLTNYSGIDAVGNSNSAALGGAGGMGIDVWGLPNPRGYSLGVNLTF